MSSPIILITGANRGLGLSLLTRLTTLPTTSTSTFLLACRDTTSGHLAATQLHTLSPSSTISILPLDITSNTSIRSATQHITSTYGRLDILINNAGWAKSPSVKHPTLSTTDAELDEIRSLWTQTININTISTVIFTSMLLPLLRHSTLPNGGLVLQVSSNRGSLSNSLIPGRLPTSVVWAYDGSKAALNKMSIELAKTELERDLGQGEKRVEVQVVCPGHCRTGFNGFRGRREPEEGVDVAVQLVGRKVEMGSAVEGGRVGFWCTEGEVGSEVVARG